MSSPGDKGRRFELLEGAPPEILTRAVELVGTVPGAHSFELAYDARDRDLAEDEEPRADEAVRWTATAVVRRKYAGVRKPLERTYTGTADVEPGDNHSQGIVYAVVNLLEAMGANTVLVDLSQPRP